MSGPGRAQSLTNAVVIEQAPALPTELYREIFMHSSEAIAIIDPQGYYIEQNSAHRQMLGYSDEELRGQTPAIHMGAEAFQRIASELSARGDFRAEVTSRTKQGKTLHIELSALALKDSSGKVLGYVGIKRDVTERNRAEEALKRSAAQLSDFFESSLVGMQWIDAQGKVIRVNQAQLDLLGYTREQYLDRSISEFYLDKDTVADVLKCLQDEAAQRDFRAWLRCGDGTEKYLSINSSVYREDGRFVHLRCFTHDITGLKRTEQRLALQYAVTRILSETTDFVGSATEILQTIGRSLNWQFGAMWKLDSNADVLRCVGVWSDSTFITPSFEKITRETAFKKGIGLPGRIWANKESMWIPNVLNDGNFPRTAYAQAENLRAAFGFPIINGSEVLGIVEFFSSEIRQPDRELLEMVGSIGRQIGQFAKRKRAEEERQELLERERTAREEAEQANRLKDEFLATLSHELRTPLNAVIGWSRMLKSGLLDTESADHALQVIERNAWAQKQIIEDILDVSRVITGKLPLKIAPVDLVIVIDGALDAVRPAMEAKDIKIETIIDTGLRLITGDPDRLQQVIWNLLSNAAKFTPPSGKVDIRVNQTNSHVQIQVSDTGPGINPTFLPHVFERFRQADGSTTRTHGGLGLGLAIVRHLVELHGGLISVENRNNGSGAIFTIKLPLPTGELRMDTVTAASSAFKEVEAEPANLSGLNILVVDDENDALDLIAMELTRHGAHVKGVTSANDALMLLAQNEFDLLISDIGLPELDGYDLIRRIRRQEAGQQKRLPAVALTAYARVEDRMRAILAGYNTHVPKPVEANELVTIVASLAGRLGKT